MKKTKLDKIFTFVVLVILALAMSRLFTRTSFGADNDQSAILEGNVDKYINYQLANGNEGTLVQYSLRTGIEYGNEFYAVKNSEMNISLNQIDGKYPTDVRVIGRTTKVTNGKTSEIEEDYNYDANTGNLVIRVSNENEKGEAINNTRPSNEDRDEFVVIAYYDTYTKEMPERDLSCDVTYTAKLFTEEELEVTGHGILTKKVKEDIGDLTSIETTRSKIYNGYIKSNVINGTEYDTEYTENNEIIISQKEAHEKIRIEEENTYENVNDIYYKSTKILKEESVNVLGETRRIEIRDGEGNEIATIDNNSFGENKEVVITYPENVNKVEIETSKIEKEGKAEAGQEVKFAIEHLLSVRER